MQGLAVLLLCFLLIASINAGKKRLTPKSKIDSFIYFLLGRLNGAADCAALTSQEACEGNGSCEWKGVTKYGFVQHSGDCYLETNVMTFSSYFPMTTVGDDTFYFPAKSNIAYGNGCYGESTDSCCVVTDASQASSDGTLVTTYNNEDSCNRIRDVLGKPLSWKSYPGVCFELKNCPSDIIFDSDDATYDSKYDSCGLREIKEGQCYLLPKRTSNCKGLSQRHCQAASETCRWKGGKCYQAFRYVTRHYCLHYKTSKRGRKQKCSKGSKHLYRN